MPHILTYMFKSNFHKNDGNRFERVKKKKGNICTNSSISNYLNKPHRHILCNPMQLLKKLEDAYMYL